MKEKFTFFTLLLILPFVFGQNCSQSNSANNNNDYQSALSANGNGAFTANDFIVSADTEFTLEQMKYNAFRNPNEPIGDVVVRYYTNVNNLPGSIIATETITPTSQNLLGSNFGFEFVELVLDSTNPQTFVGQTGVDTTYWIAILTSSDAFRHSGLEGTVDNIVGNYTYTTIDNGVTWDLFFDLHTGSNVLEDAVYELSGQCSTLSTKENEKQSFKIIANAPDDIVTIKNNHDIVIDNISVVDINGRVILNKQEDLKEINISNLSSGVYFVRIETKDEIFTKKILKK